MIFECILYIEKRFPLINSKFSILHGHEYAIYLSIIFFHWKTDKIIKSMKWKGKLSFYSKYFIPLIFYMQMPISIGLYSDCCTPGGVFAILI